MKVVINTRIGGFRLSLEGLAEYVRQKGFEPEIKDHKFGPFTEPQVFCNGEVVYSMNIDRNEPALVRTVEKLGEAANSEYTYLKIVDIPDDVDYLIVEADCGIEHIAERHRTWD